MTAYTVQFVVKKYITTPADDVHWLFADVHTVGTNFAAYVDIGPNYVSNQGSPLLAIGGNSEAVAPGLWRLNYRYQVVTLRYDSSGETHYFINGIICNYLRFARADDLKLILIDLKRMEFNYYAAAPHLMRPVIADPEEAIEVLDGLVKEILSRAVLMAVTSRR